MVGFGKEWVAGDDERIVNIFESMFEDTHIRRMGGVELYHRYHRWHGRGENAYDDYTDTTLAYYDLNAAQGKVSSLLTRLDNDGAETVPVCRHGELLRFLLQNESSLYFCSREFLRNSKLLKWFSDYDFVVSDDRHALAISRREEIIAEYDYNAIRSYIAETMWSESVYPCCLNLFMTQVLMEHPEALISINDYKEFRYVMVNLNTLYQRWEIASELNRQMLKFDVDSYRNNVIKPMEEDSIRNMVQPNYVDMEALLLNYM